MTTDPQWRLVCEETGELDALLDDVADYYQREVDYTLKNLSAMIEPILIVFVGGAVLVLALGVFLPMWNMIAKVGGGGSGSVRQMSLSKRSRVVSCSAAMSHYSSFDDT